MHETHFKQRNFDKEIFLASDKLVFDLFGSILFFSRNVAFYTFFVTLKLLK